MLSNDMKTLMFSVNEKTLGKITIDNSVRYIPVTEKTKERHIKPKTKTFKAGSLPRKQNKIFSQNNRKFVKNFAASGFGYIAK